MSDAAAEPGAPTDGAAKARVPDNNAPIHGALQPTSAIGSLLSAPDRVLLRLNKYED